MSNDFETEFLKLRQKRKREEEQVKKNKKGNKIISTGKPLVSVTDDISPVVSVRRKNAVDTSENEEIAPDRTWFKKSSYLKDGRDKGDISKAVLGTIADVGKNIASGFIGTGERALDALIAYGNAKSNADMARNNLNLMTTPYAFTKKGKKIAKDVVNINKAVHKEGDKIASSIIQKDLYNEDAIAKKIIADPFEKFTGINSGEASVLGDKSAGVLQSAGQLAASRFLAPMAGSWEVVTGINSIGSDTEKALNEGASLEEATMSGVISAAGEILSEKLSGAISFGGNTLDDALIKPVIDKIGNKAVKALVKLGVDATGEGFEEIVSGVISNLGTAIYKDDKISELIAGDEAIDEYIESFIGGAFLGGVSSGVKSVANRGKVNNNTEFSENETKVIDEVVKNRISKKEKDGNKLSKKQKAQIKNEVINDLEKGYIETDIIESILGGDEYEAYKRVKESGSNYEGKLNEAINRLKSEYDKLNDMPRGEMTGKQQDRQAEIKDKIKLYENELQEYKGDSRLSELKKKIGENVSSLVKDSKLYESYSEAARRKELFEADLSAYDEKQKEVIKKAIDSKVLNNTNRTHDFVDMLAKISANKNLSFDFVDNKKIQESGFALEGKTINGYVTADGKMAVNIDSKKSLETVVGHEITHIIEGTEFYKELQGAIEEHAKAKGEYDIKMQSLSKLYSEVYEKEGFDEKIKAEFTADMVGEYIFSDSDFVNNLSANKPSLFRRIYNEIKYLYKVTTAGSKEEKALLKIKKAFENAYKESSKSTSADTRYSISETTDENLDTTVDSEGNKLSKQQSEYFKNSKARDDDGNLLKVYHGSDADFTVFDKTKGRSNMDIQGSFFSPYEIDAKGYGKNVKAYYLNITKPASEGMLYKALNKFKGQNYAGIKAREYLESLGYDGVCGYDEYIVFDSNQIKAVNNINPTNDVDVNYSLSAEDNTNNKNGKFFGKDLKHQTEVVDKSTENKTKSDEYYSSEDYKHILNENPIAVRETISEDFYSPLSEEEANANYEEEKEYINKFSDEDMPKETENETYYLEDEINIDELTLKKLSKVVSDYLSLSKGSRTQLEKIIRDFSVNKYSSKNELYNAVKDSFGVRNYEETNEQLKEAKNVIKSLKIFVSPTEKSEFGSVKDYNQFMRNNFGKISFSKEGLPVDVVYTNLNTMYANLFPEDVWNSADQLKRIAEVVNMPTAELIAEDLPEEMISKATDLIFDNVIEYRENEILNTSYETQKEANVSLFEEKLPLNDETVKKYAVNESESRKVKKAELKKDYQQKKLSLEKELKDKDSFVSKTAQQLYDELKNLKKGVRASQELGYLLDFDFNWSELKSTLLKVGKWPNTVINSNSEVESIVREAIERKYKDSIYDFENLEEEYQNKLKEIESQKPNISFKNQNEIKLYEYQAELTNNYEMKKESFDTYTEQIKRLQAEYEGKKDKHSLVATKILQRIERLDRLRETTDIQYEKRINDLRSKIDKMNSKEFRTAQQRTTKQQAYFEEVENIVGDTSTWVDKEMGILYSVNTLRRNLRDIVRDSNGKKDIKKADKIYDYFMGKYNHNQAELNKETNRIIEPFADLKITNAEDEYIQMLGEYRHNPDCTLTAETIDDFYEKHKTSIDKDKVDKVIDMARFVYDDLIKRVNAVLSNEGMKEIPYRKGYFPHFNEEKQSKIAKLLNWKTKSDNIPTDIAGLTEEFKPVRSYQSFDKQRLVDDTVYSFSRGLDRYVAGALDWIYHIEDIQKRRAFENYIRYTHSETGIKEKIDAINNNESYDADEAQEQIDLVYKEAKNPLNNFIQDFRTATNTLANKKSSFDRGLERYTNRKVYSTMTNLSNRVSGNMVAGSVSSALTNFIPITQSWVEVKPKNTLTAMKQTIASAIKDDGTVDKSDFLTNRLNEGEKLYKSAWDKISSGLGWLMDSIDNFTSQTVWRSKYIQNLAEGMDESSAIKNADQFSENVMAGRSKGNQPTLFDSKNPIIKTFTAFQLEVNNQYGYFFKDAPIEMANEGKYKLLKGYATAFLGAYVYNALYSSVAGRDAAFDPIGIIEDLLKDLFKTDDEEDEKNVVNAISNLGSNIIDEVPFVGGLLGGGRVPLSSALPYGGVTEMIEGTYEDISEMSLKSIENLTSQWLNPVFYLALPAGGGQLKKTWQGLKMFDKDLPVTGSYTKSGALRFPVEDNLKNKVQAAVFGQYANKNAREYFDNDYAPLNEKQIAEYKETGIPISEYRKYKKDLSSLKTINEKGDYIGNLDLPVSKKNILINNIAKREAPIDYKNYSLYEDFEEFDFAVKNPDKYKVLKENGISVSKYNKKYKDKYSDDFSWAANNPDKYTFSKAVTSDLIKYREYISGLYEIRADKDKNGKSISGSAKAKKKAYIWSLDIDEGAKYILFKNEYKSEDSYNNEIIDYIIDKEGLSTDEKRSVLQQLDFIIDDDGYISWR